MSRRTKLIITALFLVLLGIPSIYIPITWRPETPLRIHLVDIHEQNEIKEGQPHRSVEIEVENTSMVPIHLGSITIHRETGTEHPDLPIGVVELASASTYPTRDIDGHPIIPAHGRWRGKVLVPQYWLSELSDKETFLQISWMSRTRYRIMDIYWSLAKHLPVPPPAYDVDRFPLEDSTH